MEEKETHILNTFVDEETNKIVKQDKWIGRSVNQKKSGYNLVYMDNLIDIIRYFTKAQIEIVLDCLTEHIYPKDFTLDFVSYKALAKEYSMSESSARKLITAMRKADVVRKTSKGYLVNPYLVLPRKMSDERITMFQIDWDKGN